MELRCIRLGLKMVFGLVALLSGVALAARISTLLGEMTLEQKVGQLIQGDIGSITSDDLRSAPGNNEFSPRSEWLALADRFYDASLDPSHGPHPIPTMWGRM